MQPDRPQPVLDARPAPVAFALRNIADRKARGRLRAAATVEAFGNEAEWTDADGWRYQLERPPVVTIAPKDNERAAATVDLKVWDAGNNLIFRDRIHAWDGFPVLVPDGTEHEEDDGLGGKVRVSNFRESPIDAARSDLAHTVRVVTKSGTTPWVKDKPGTVSTFYAGTGDGYIYSASSVYSQAASGSGSSKNSYTAITYNYVGQLLTGSDYYCDESFVAFDTSTIPDSDTITSSILSLYNYTDSSSTDFTVEARLYDWGASLTTADWISNASLSSYTLLASKATSGWATGYNEFSENGSAFVNNTSKTGTTYIVLNSDRHRAGTAPSGNEYVGFSTADQAGTTQDPKLVVTHATPATASSVSASYGSKTRTGPSNTPWTLNFTGGGPINAYQVRTAAGGGGSLVASGAASAGANAPTIAYNATGLVQGSNTLYLRVSSDSGSTFDNEYAFTLLRDDSVSAPTSISHSPNPVESNNQYSVTFTATDTYSTSTNEMSYQVRTAAGGGGTLLASGNFTQGTGKSTSTFTDSGLTDGATRYLRVFDGANNVAEQSFTVTKVTTKPFRRALLGVGF